MGVKQDQENRYLQLSLMQNQRDLAMLPPEAAQRLVDANYTLCKYRHLRLDFRLNTLSRMFNKCFRIIFQHGNQKVRQMSC